MNPDGYVSDLPKEEQERLYAQLPDGGKAFRDLDAILRTLGEIHNLPEEPVDNL